MSLLPERMLVVFHCHYYSVKFTIIYLVTFVDVFFISGSYSLLPTHMRLHFHHQIYECRLVLSGPLTERSKMFFIPKQFFGALQLLDGRFRAIEKSFCLVVIFHVYPTAIGCH